MTQLTHIDGTYTAVAYLPGLTFRYRLSIPQVAAARFALLVEHDGPNEAHTAALLRLAQEGLAPYCITLGIYPGKLTMADGTCRDMRLHNYDRFHRAWGDFLVYEFIPHVQAAHGLALHPGADWHMISGASSGGIAAFAAAWFHSDYFHRVYMSSPSFLAMGRGNELPYLVRKHETLPLRIYQEHSEREPNDYFGASRPIDEEACAAFTFARYDFCSRYFPGEGHISRYRDPQEAYTRCQWLWRGWQDAPITAPGNSPRVDAVVPFGTTWRACDAFPAAQAAPLCPAAPAGYDHAVCANDGLAWYGANAAEATVYLHPAGQSAPLVHTMLHTLPGQDTPGALGLAVDQTDRLYVLSAMGIQCVRAYGLVDVILPLPDGTRPLRIAVADALYVQSEGGIYRRPLCPACTTPGPQKRLHVSYYD